MCCRMSVIITNVKIASTKICWLQRLCSLRHHIIFLNFFICCLCYLLPISNFSNGHTTHRHTCMSPFSAYTKSNQGGEGVSVDIYGLGLIHIVLSKISFYVYCKLVFLFFLNIFVCACCWSLWEAASILKTQCQPLALIDFKFIIMYSFNLWVYLFVVFNDISKQLIFYKLFLLITTLLYTNEKTTKISFNWAFICM